MDIKECFKPQLDEPQIVDEELYKKLKTKYYYNDRKVEIGDKMLYALLVNKNEYFPVDYSVSPPITSEEPANSITMTLIVIHEDDMNDYEPFKGYDNAKTIDRIPIISKIEKDGK